MRGHTLISFIIGSALAALLTTLLLADAHHLFSLQMEISLRSQMIQMEIKLREILDAIARDTDSHPLDILPRVHKGNQIRYADGELNPISSHSTINGPIVGSDAISSLSLKSMELLKVLSVTQKGSGFEYYVCSIFKSPVPSNEEEAFIGINADGPVYLRGSIKSARGKSACFILELKQQKNMLVNLRCNLAPLGARLLIPIEKEYTLYLSKKAELRYLGHLGSQNIENQPLFASISELHFNATMKPGENLPLFTLDVLFPKERSFSYASASHLARFSHFNLIMN